MRTVKVKCESNLQPWKLGVWTVLPVVQMKKLRPQDMHSGAPDPDPGPTVGGLEG